MIVIYNVEVYKNKLLEAIFGTNLISGKHIVCFVIVDIPELLVGPLVITRMSLIISQIPLSTTQLELHLIVTLPSFWSHLVDWARRRCLCRPGSCLTSCFTEACRKGLFSNTGRNSGFLLSAF